jgi:hypothetical protein
MKLLDLLPSGLCSISSPAASDSYRQYVQRRIDWNWRSVTKSL